MKKASSDEGIRTCWSKSEMKLHKASHVKSQRSRQTISQAKQTHCPRIPYNLLDSSFCFLQHGETNQPPNLTPFQGYHKVQKTKLRFWSNTLQASEKKKKKTQRKLELKFSLSQPCSTDSKQGRLLQLQKEKIYHWSPPKRRKILPQS